MKTTRRAALPAAAVCVIVGLALAHSWFGCTFGHENPAQQEESASASGTVGPEGGSIETENGARIVVPAGALDHEVTITLNSYPSNNVLPGGWCPLPGMAGALGLEPDGLDFALPVQITVPLDSSWSPGDQLPLFVFDAGSGLWEQTADNVTIAAGGSTFVAEITHFSAYGGGSVEGLAGGGGVDQFKSDFTDWYRSNVLDLGAVRCKDNECFELVGIAFDLTFKRNAEEGGDYWVVGRKSDYPDPPLLMVDYTYDTSNGHSVDGYVRITVTNYYDCTKPDFLMRSDRSVLLEGESTTVYAELACAGESLTGKAVTFDIQSGSGEVSPGNTTTNASGIATTTYTAEDETSVVRAFYYSCPMGTGETMERTCPIAVAPDQFNLSITYDQTMTFPDYTSSLSYSGTVVISVTGDNGDGSADVSGSNTFPVTGGGTAGDCTMDTVGSMSFTFTGTLVTDAEGSQTLHLTQEPYLDYETTTYCPDQDPFTNTFSGGEGSEFVLPVENGHTIEQTQSAGGMTQTIVYVLTF